MIEAYVALALLVLLVIGLAISNHLNFKAKTKWKNRALHMKALANRVDPGHSWNWTDQ